MVLFLVGLNPSKGLMQGKGVSSTFNHIHFPFYSRCGTPERHRRRGTAIKEKEREKEGERVRVRVRVRARLKYGFAWVWWSGFMLKLDPKRGFKKGQMNLFLR